MEIYCQNHMRQYAWRYVTRMSVSMRYTVSIACVSKHGDMLQTCQ